MPDEDLVRLAAAARAGGSGWDTLAEACGIPSDGYTTGAERLFRDVQHAVGALTDGRYYSPLRWTCPGCWQQVADRAAAGRPVHVEHGHAPGCARLAGAQAADDEQRQDRLPRLVLHSEPALGPLQRHWLRERITDDCPRCGWHGYFHHYIATVDGDWSAAVCDDCYADLHPDITVTVRYFSACYGGREPFGAIRQRTRSDHDYPDIGHFPDRGQIITWQLAWEFTPLLVEEAHGGADADSRYRPG